MIIFTYNEDIVNDKPVYWLGSTHCTKKDVEHESQIYEQLDAELTFNL